MLRLYGDSAVLAAKRAARAWPVAFSLVLYAAITMVFQRVLAPLGMIGGFILGIIFAACLSSYIHLIAIAVGGGKARWVDLKQSFLARFWDVISVLFAFWIIDLIRIYVIAPAMGPRADVIQALIGLAMAVFFNPVPELLYQGQSRSFQLLSESARFISRHGLEWLAPNILFALALLAPLGMLHGPVGQIVLTVSSLLSASTTDGVGLFALFVRAPIWLQLPMLLFVHWLMIFRGILFREILSGGARRRAIRGAWGR